MEYVQSVDTVSYPRSVPELSLLAAVLEMAYRDLGDHPFSSYRRSAIMWFRGKLDCGDFPEFSFDEIAHFLRLSPTQIAFIFERVDRAEDYEYKLKEKGIESRARLGTLVKRTRRRVSSPNPTIQRKGRDLGCGSASRAA